MQSRALRDVKSTISGETWAIVYAYESPRRPRHLWYDRWRYDVLNDYVQAASILGAEPYILDIDQFIISDALRRGEFDFVVNLNSGATPISNLGLVPSLAQWHRTPCFPNTADVILAGERKDICKRVFATWFKVPRDANSLQDTADATFIRKPRTMGNSQGVIRCDKVQGGTADDFFEEFIAGYDVTIPVYYDIEIGDYVVAAAVTYFPEVGDPRQWFLSYDEKMQRSGSIERRLMDVDDSLRRALLDASR